MVLISDYTYLVKNVPVNANEFFCFVSSVQSKIIPPLGDLNWKQGKIGIGKAIDFNGLRGNLYPGGGGGFWYMHIHISERNATTLEDFFYKLSHSYPQSQHQDCG